MANDDSINSFDINKALQQAVAHHHANRLHDAEKLYRDILRVQPQHPDANHNLGILALHVNQPGVALQYLKTALDCNPNQGQFWLSYIDALLKAGQIDNARQVLQRAVDRGLRGPAVDNIAQQLTKFTTVPVAQKNLSLKNKNKISTAFRAGSTKKNKLRGKNKDKAGKGKLVRQAETPPPQEINSLILAYNQGCLVEAESTARSMTQRYPHFPLGWNVLGLTQVVLGRSEEALRSMKQAVSLMPNNVEAYNNLGTFFTELGRLADAEASYRHALSITPDHPGVLTNLAKLLRCNGHLIEAEERLLHALSLNPDYADAHVGLGNVRKDLGRLNEAEYSYRKALSYKPDYAAESSNLMLSTSSNPNLLSNREYDIVFSNLLFSINGNPDCATSDCLAEAQCYGKTLSARVKPFCVWPFLNREPLSLRVGLVSGDIRRHPVGYFLESALGHLCGKSIELFAYVTQSSEDDLTERLKPYFVTWRSLVGLSDAEASQRIYDDGIHILIDLAGHTASNRLPVFAFKPAPVQVSWLGYFATTGIEQMDYLLADRVGVPVGHQADFNEHIWYLPETRLCFTPPDVDVPIAPLPASNCGHITFGCFQNSGKINDTVLAEWGRILNMLPGSVLRLQNKALEDLEVCNYLKERLVAQGIKAGQVLLCGGMDRNDYLISYAEVDIILDTFPYPGGTTTCEALWMGVPTLTLAGDTMLARQGASLLTAAGLPDWVAASQDEYVAKAVAFARDLPRLARLREGLREQVRRSPLFDAERFAKNLEAALLAMWRCWVEKYPGV